MAKFIFFDRKFLRKQLRNSKGDDNARETRYFFSMGSRKRSRWNKFYIKRVYIKNWDERQEKFAPEKRRRKMTNVSFRRARANMRNNSSHTCTDISFLGKSGFQLKISLPSSWRHPQCGHVVRSSSYVDRALGDPSNDEDPCGHESSWVFPDPHASCCPSRWPRLGWICHL